MASLRSIVNVTVSSRAFAVTRARFPAIFQVAYINSSTGEITREPKDRISGPGTIKHWKTEQQGVKTDHGQSGQFDSPGRYHGEQSNWKDGLSDKQAGKTILSNPQQGQSGERLDHQQQRRYDVDLFYIRCATTSFNDQCTS
jgi:hypothetical protein